jgi:penicillin-binding protein 2
MNERAARTATSTSIIVRLTLAATFLVFCMRLYSLQIVSGASYQEQAAVNRLRVIDADAPRGVIYDRNGEILARNRPSFVIAVIPADLPPDDIATEINEQRIALERLLAVLEADSDPEMAIRIAEVMFLHLGREDFKNTVVSAGITLSFRLIDLEVLKQDEEGREIIEVVPTWIPDLAEPLPVGGLLALLERAVAIGTQGSSYKPVSVLDLVDREQAFQVAEETYQLRGVHVLQKPVREYPYRELAGHVLGFLGPIPKLAAEKYKDRGYEDPNESVGLNGLEYTYQDSLRGLPGKRLIEVDILGRESRTVNNVREPEPGLNLNLSLDIHLQEFMHNALARQLEETGAPHGVALAMDPRSGAMLGLVSLPSYDNNIFSEGLGEEYKALEVEDDTRRPLYNYAIGGLYPPGSTFKLVSATAALAEHVITPSTTLVDRGPIFLPNYFFPDDATQAQEFVSWNHKLNILHGPMTIIKGIGLSNDIFFYYLGGGFPNFMDGLGSERLAKWMRLYGFGELTGVDLPGEVLAFVPDEQWKRLTKAESWTTGDSYNMAIGQGDVLGTPMQVLVSTAAVANGGYVVKPQFVQQMVDTQDRVQWQYEPIMQERLPVDPGLLAYVQKGMWYAVNGLAGTAYYSRVEGVTVAGKTGTAEFCAYDPEIQDCTDRDHEGNLPFHAWYTAYAPYEDPEIVVTVFVYSGGEGSAVALPVAQEILHAWFHDLRP